MGSFAQGRLSDEQVVQYVKDGMAQGKSQTEIISELRSQGVTAAQAQRIKAIYDVAKSDAEAAKKNLQDNKPRAHTLASDEDVKDIRKSMEEQLDREKPGSAAVEEDGEDIPIYGRDIFSNRQLNFAPSQNLATPRNYRLGPGDEVIIDIFGANQTTLRSTISPEGSINVDVLGPLYISGMTIEEANAFLKRKLSGIYRGLNRSASGTDIRLSLGQIRTIQVNVLGDVANPGTYMLSSFSTVFHALYRAGGVVGVGTLRNILVNRGGGVAGTVDVYEYITGGSRDSDFRLEEGDVIVVRPYESIVKIDGEVRRPMRFELKEGETLADLLRYAGGFNSGAFTENLNVVRQSGKNFEVRTVAAKDFSAFALADGDEITVGKLNSLFENKVSISGSVYQPGEYELGDGIKTVRQLVEKAGGLMPDAFTHRAVLTREHDDKTMEVLSVNLGRLLDGSEPDVALRKNDALFITSESDIKELPTMSISGMVKNPSTFTYAENATVRDLIIMAGGLLEGASLSRIDISRRKRDVNGLVKTDAVGELYSIDLGDDFLSDSGNDFVLEPYDHVMVHKSPVYNEQVNVSVTGEANFAGDFSLTSRNERLSDIVAKAGGATDYAYLKGARLFRNMEEGERKQLMDILNYRGNAGKEQLDTLDIYLSANEYQVSIQLDKALAKPGSGYDIELMEGDILDIPYLRNTVRVMGAVMMPATLSYTPGKSGRSYVNSCGGFASNARSRKAYVVHMNGSSERMGMFTAIEPGDYIVVPEKPAKQGVTTDVLLQRGAMMISSLASVGTMIGYIIYLNK
ncbi:MAG: SLBB domain-containing protein [Bacteroidales bacterium]|nr:SLBB domain-containing protein [Bacteroidales bacterium]